MRRICTNRVHAVFMYSYVTPVGATWGTALQIGRIFNLACLLLYRVYLQTHGEADQPDPVSVFNCFQAEVNT